MSTSSSYLGHRARLRLLELGGRSPSYQDVGGDGEAENMRKRLLSGPTVEIFVGSERKQWSLHRNLLCHHSSYFEAQVDAHDTLELPSHDPRGFELLVKWLYQGQLEDTSHLSDEAKYDYAVACHKLYLLCEKFDMVKLKNIAMDQYRSCLNECHLVPDAEEINEIYRASSPASPFRSLMIKIAARQIMDPDSERDAEAYRRCFEGNEDFAVEMINAIRYMSGGILFEDPTAGQSCAYHDHGDVAGCPLEGKGKGRMKGRTMNGQGPTITPAADDGRPPAYMTIPELPELSSEKRTPRKLNTPAKSLRLASPSVQKATSDGRLQSPVANQGARRPSKEEVESQPSQKLPDIPLSPESEKNTPITPRSQPRKIERRGRSKIPPQPQPQHHPPSTILRLSVPKANNSTAANPPIISPTPTRNNEAHRPRKLSHRRTATDALSTTTSAVSTASRKRKMADRTPRRKTNGIMNETGGPRPPLGRAATSTSSTASKPRKLSRVSSVEKQYDVVHGGIMNIDERSQCQNHTRSTGSMMRRAPPKLRVKHDATGQTI